MEMRTGTIVPVRCRGVWDALATLLLAQLLYRLRPFNRDSAPGNHHVHHRQRHLRRQNQSATRRVLDGSGIARLPLDKQFHGDLDAVSKGRMLAAATATKGSAGYIAILKKSPALSPAAKAASFSSTSAP